MDVKGHPTVDDYGSVDYIYIRHRGI